MKENTWTLTWFLNATCQHTVISFRWMHKVPAFFVNFPLLAYCYFSKKHETFVAKWAHCRQNIRAIGVICHGYLAVQDGSAGCATVSTWGLMLGLGVTPSFSRGPLPWTQNKPARQSALLVLATDQSAFS